MEGTQRLGLARESYVLIVICTIDLLLTAWLVTTERAAEGNPIMSFYLNSGWRALVTVKLMLVVLPLFVAEWGRRYRPEFVRRALRFAIIAYLGIYATALLDIGMLLPAVVD